MQITQKTIEDRAMSNKLCVSFQWLQYFFDRESKNPPTIVSETAEMNDKAREFNVQDKKENLKTKYNKKALHIVNETKFIINEKLD